MLSSLVAAAACQSPPAEIPSGDGEIVYTDQGLGLTFALPADWAMTHAGTAVVFAGASPETHFTTLTLQASTPGPDAELAAVLDTTYASLDEAPIAWRARVPVDVAAGAGLAYLVSFTLWEKPRLRAGVLLRVGDSVADLSYTAPAELFAAGLDAYERAFETLVLEPPDGGYP